MQAEHEIIPESREERAAQEQEGDALTSHEQGLLRNVVLKLQTRRLSLV